MIKKAFAASLILLLIAAMSIPAFAAPMDIEAFKGVPVIDGKKDDVYNETTVYPIENFTANSTGKTKGALNMLWDGNTLYFYVESYDTTPWTEEITTTHLADCFEFFLDLNSLRGDNFNYDDFSFVQLRIDNVGTVSGNNTGDSWSLQPEVTDNLKFAIGFLNGKDLAGGYAVEASLDVSPFTTLSEGKVIGFDIQLADIQGDGTVRAVQAFLGNTETSLLDTQYNTPVNCGANIVFKGPVPVPPPPETESVPEPAAEAEAPAVVNPKTSDAAVYLIPALVALFGLMYIKKQAGISR